MQKLPTNNCRISIVTVNSVEHYSMHLLQTFLKRVISLFVQLSGTDDADAQPAIAKQEALQMQRDRATRFVTRNDKSHFLAYSRSLVFMS